MSKAIGAPNLIVFTGSLTSLATTWALCQPEKEKIALSKAEMNVERVKGLLVLKNPSKCKLFGKPVMDLGTNRA
ncbi:unnamed protein product [Ambrosiozyma monospora]|uniref:Unnamed protein product n=1 Tax=Ambrosiozyma monospora TaxID=43982 RepID=A0ACB5U3M5_AMBMO|nr:unnamed protein product [Ambrosiozyma monospora]